MYPLNKPWEAPYQVGTMFPGDFQRDSGLHKQDRKPSEFTSIIQQAYLQFYMGVKLGLPFSSKNIAL
jgi:hypothetical protein